MKTIIYLFAISIFSFFLSCTNNAAEQQTTHNINTSTEKQFEDVFNKTHFGMSKKEIKDNALGDLVEDKSDYLIFSQDIEGNDFVDITYSFSNSSLQKIEANYFTKTPESAQKIHNKHQTEFNQSYDNRKPSFWDGKNGDTDITVFLKLMNKKDNPGVLVVWEKIQ